jgi:hypothetical protein
MKFLKLIAEKRMQKFDHFGEMAIHKSGQTMLISWSAIVKNINTI